MLFQELLALDTPWSRTDFTPDWNAPLAHDRCPVHAVRGAGNKASLDGDRNGAVDRSGAGLYHDVANSLLTHGIPTPVSCLSTVRST